MGSKTHTLGMGDSTQQLEVGAFATAAPSLWRELARPTATPPCSPEVPAPSPLLA